MHCNGTFTLNMGVWCNAQYLIFKGLSFFFGKTYLIHWGPAENPWGFAATLEDPGESPARNFGIGWGEGEGGKWQQKRTKACLLPCLYEEEKTIQNRFMFMCFSANTSAASFAHFLHSLLGPPRLCAPGWNKRVSSLISYSCLWILTLGAAADVKAVVSLSWWHFEEPQFVFKRLPHFHFWLILNFSTFTFFST